MHRWRILAAALLAATTAAACAERATEGPLVADPAFYELSAPVAPGDLGGILRSERIPGAPDGGRVWRVLYRSESLAGEPVAVSGIIAAPAGDPPEGGWPVLSIAHGTVGLGDACAPSRDPGTTASEAAKRGVVVVATDYEGLGPAGPHPYLVGESAGRSVIDAVRAARAMGDDVGAGSRYVVLGFSQGGHAALFANEIAAAWAPELELVGTAAGAPVVEMEAWVEHLVATEQAWLISMVLTGLAAVDPAVDPAAVLTPAGRELLPLVAEGCSPEVLEAFGSTPGAGLVAPPSSLDPLGPHLAGNTPGRVAGSSPVFLAHGDADELVPAALVDAAVARLCATGQVVEHRDYPGVDHVGIIEATFFDAAAWLLERLDGHPTPSTC